MNDYDSFMERISYLQKKRETAVSKKNAVCREIEDIENMILNTKREFQRSRIKMPVVSLREFQKANFLWINKNALIDTKKRVVAYICTECGEIDPRYIQSSLLEPIMFLSGVKPELCKCRSYPSEIDWC